MVKKGSECRQEPDDITDLLALRKEFYFIPREERPSEGFEHMILFTI